MSRRHLTVVGQGLRDNCDRRADDVGPPMGWRERRRHVERRMPTVKEDEISQYEWFRCLAFFRLQRRAEREAIRRAFEYLEMQNRGY